MIGEHLSDAGEADFLFEIGWVDHWLKLLGRKGTQFYYKKFQIETMFYLRFTVKLQ